MKLIKICTEDVDRIAPLVAAFRVQLKSYKGIQSKLNIKAGKEEIREFLNSDLTRWIVNNKEIVKYFYEDVVSKNLIDEAAHFLSAEDVEEMCQHLIAVRNTYPDYTMSITRQFEDGEYVVSEFVMRGTHSGEFLGITPTNKTIEIKGVNIDKIVDGKITEHSGVANTFEAFWENGLIKSV